MATRSHEPQQYVCPFCQLQRGSFDEWNRPSDIVAVAEHAYARVAPKWWPNNPGAVLVMPRMHVENIYALPSDIGHDVWDLTQRIATGIRASYDCEGTSIRQHNEPAGDQDVWHVHVHVFPRFVGDELYLRHGESEWVSPDERAHFARLLRRELGEPIDFGDLGTRLG